MTRILLLQIYILSISKKFLPIGYRHLKLLFHFGFFFPVKNCSSALKHKAVMIAFHTSMVNAVLVGDDVHFLVTLVFVVVDDSVVVVVVVVGGDDCSVWSKAGTSTTVAALVVAWVLSFRLELLSLLQLLKDFNSLLVVVDAVVGSARSIQVADLDFG
jgi:hypothetical protein